MKNNYILVDYENVQPTKLALLADSNFKIIVFVGSNQAKLPFELVTSMQALGGNANYIKIEGNGPNALDFHIAFYMGKIAEKDVNAYFHIVSKDTGFDPLIKHMRDNKTLAQRVADIAEIVSPSTVSQQSPEARTNTVIARLKAMKTNKPRTVKSLENTINSIFLKKLSESEVDYIVGKMKAKKPIIVEGVTLTYSTGVAQPE